MRKLVMLLSLLSYGASADETGVQLRHVDKSALKSAQKVEYAGILLACLGSATVIGSYFLDPFSIGIDNPDASDRARSNAGLSVLVIGSLAAATGTAMWIVGGVKARRVEQVVIVPNGFGARF